MNNIIIVGAFQETIELCEEAGYHIVGIVENNITGDYRGIPIIGTDSDASTLAISYMDCGVVITPDKPKIREKLSIIFESVGFIFPTIISPGAHISKSATLSDGCIIQSGVNISSDVKIGRNVKLNFNVNIMHDVTVGDYSVIAPNSVLLGRASIRRSSYVGANSTILTGATVQAYSDIKPCSIYQ